MHRRAAFAFVVLTIFATGALSATPVQADHAWADPDQATIRPGNRIGGCTTNFVFTSGTDVFLGTAAHCFKTSSSSFASGCYTGTRPLGSTISIQGATKSGVLVYSSWITMQARGEPADSSQCRYNDFALVRVHPDDHPRVSPAMRFFGGPEGMANSATIGTQVITYGSTPLRPGITVNPVASTHAHEGTVVQTAGGLWSYSVYTATPGLPGDSGSGVMTNDGDALGILVTLHVAPLTGANGVTSLYRALGYANQHSGSTYTLELETLTNNGLLTP